MPPQTVKTRFVLLSDTHTQVPKPSKATTHAFREPVPTADVLLHAGDLTKVGYEIEYEKTLDFLKSANAELKLVIAGNHDITLHEDWYRDTQQAKKKHMGRSEDLKKCKKMWTGEEAKKAGIVYLEEGIRRFSLKSGVEFTVYSSPWQPEYYDWAFTYNRREDRFNPSPSVVKTKAANPIPDHPNIDVMLTHGPPMGILDRTSHGEHVGCEHLRRAVQRCKPRLHCFGHIHEGWGVERMYWKTEEATAHARDQQKILQNRSAYYDVSEGSGSPLKWGKETLFVNASIMDVHSNPTNAPFVVDMDLPVKGLAQDENVEA
ncbi:hypothetical protein MMC28_003930 [Mycoblastus sanguinarius]|nr:hypothetical protein [Mycoblastus sanguinarius]